MEMTRRAFVSGTAAVAVGAVAGIPSSEGIKRHGPVEIRTYFFLTEPIVLQGSLLTDPGRDLFRVYAIIDAKKEPLIADMPLSAMKKVMQSGLGCVPIKMSANGKSEQASIGIRIDQENVTFLFGDTPKDGAPVWIKLPEVQQVL